MWSTITDNELDQLVKRLMEGNRKIGPNAMKARLEGQGLY